MNTLVTHFRSIAEPPRGYQTNVGWIGGRPWKDDATADLLSAVHSAPDSPTVRAWLRHAVKATDRSLPIASRRGHRREMGRIENQIRREARAAGLYR